MHEGAGLTHAVADDVAQRGVQQMGRRVVPLGVLAPGGVDRQLDACPDGELAFDDLEPVQEDARAGLLHVR